MNFHQGALTFVDNKIVSTLHEASGFGVIIGRPAVKHIESSLSAIGGIGIRQIGYL